jgi:hypothetical protein
LSRDKVVSQEVYFEKIQNYLNTHNQDPLGVCRHAHSNLEKTANDMGIRAAEVEGWSGSHAYDILKIENGTAILSWGSILMFNTKNIEKALEAFEKGTGHITFQHQFFEDSQIKDKITTRDGKHFLDLVGYDDYESVNNLKDSLLNPKKPKSKFSVILNGGTYSNSIELNGYGFFVKKGQMFGDSSSAIDQLDLIQGGYRDNLSIFGLSVSPSVSFFQSLAEGEEKKEIHGETANLTVSTNNEKGLNLSMGFSHARAVGAEYMLYFDSFIESGVSYKLPINNFTIEPYFIFKWGLFPYDVGTWDYAYVPSEMNTGINLGVEVNNTKFSIDPHYAKRIWEQELGIDGKIKAKNLEFSVGGYTTKSNYDFCPDKTGFSVNMATSFDKFVVSLGFRDEIQNYSGETSSNPEASIKVKLKL